MDISDINKNVNQKRFDEEVEKSHKMVSDATKKIIEIQVNQDTAYWDLKVHQKQVKINYEKLQQNMQNVQMQCETTSSKYQEELRFRQETLNKLNHTREISDVVLNYSERLKEILTRVTSDQKLLHQAYSDSGQQIQKFKIEHRQIQECSKLKIESLLEKTKLMAEQMDSLRQAYVASNQQLQSELASTLSALNDAQIKRDEMNGSLNDAYRQLEQCKLQLKKKDESHTNLQNKVRQALQQFHSTLNFEDSITNQQNNMNQNMESNQSFQSSLSNQEAFTKVLSASLEEHKQASGELKKLEKHSEVLSNAQKEIENLNSHIHKMEIEKIEMNTQLNNKIKELDSKTVKIQELVNQVTGLENNNQELENKYKIHRETFEGQMKQMSSIIENKEKELNSKSEIVNELMSEVKNNAEVRTNLETHIQKLKAEIEIEKANAKERENKLEAQVERFMFDVKEKEEQIQKAMQEMLGIRAAKDALQDKLTNMHYKINNIQKEFIAGGVPEPREPTEQDDIAMPFPVNTIKAPTTRPPSNKPPFDPVSNVRNVENSGECGDSIDSVIVNSRIEAQQRGEHLSPVLMPTRKRRRPRRPSPVHCATDQQNPLQLTQAKNNPVKEYKFFKSKSAKKY